MPRPIAEEDEATGAGNDNDNDNETTRSAADAAAAVVPAKRVSPVHMVQSVAGNAQRQQQQQHQQPSRDGDTSVRTTTGRSLRYRRYTRRVSGRRLVAEAHAASISSMMSHTGSSASLRSFASTAGDHIDLVVSDSYSSSGEDDNGHHFHRHHHRKRSRRMWHTHHVGLFWQPDAAKQGGALALIPPTDDVPDTESHPTLQTHHVSPSQASIGNEAATRCVVGRFCMPRECACLLCKRASVCNNER